MKRKPARRGKSKRTIIVEVVLPKKTLHKTMAIVAHSKHKSFPFQFRVDPSVLLAAASKGKKKCRLICDEWKCIGENTVKCWCEKAHWECS